MAAASAVQGSSISSEMRTPSSQRGGQTGAKTEAIFARIQMGFQQVKEKAVWVWQTAVMTFQVAGGKVAFVFFRGLEFISPNLALRAENAYLYVSNIVESVKTAQEQGEAREELETLRIQNRDLNAQVQIYRRSQGDADRLRQENGLLTEGKRRVEEQNLGLRQQVEAMRLQEANMAAREGAVVQDRDLLVQQNELVRQERGDLRRENQMLTEQYNQARDALARANQEKEGLQRQVAALQEQIPALQRALTLANGRQEVEAQLAQLNQTVQQVAERPDNEKTELDDQLEVLLPALLQNIQAAQADLKEAADELTESLALQARLQGINQGLEQIVQMLQAAPQAFRLHSSWQNPLLEGRSTSTSPIMLWPNVHRPRQQMIEMGV